MQPETELGALGLRGFRESFQRLGDRAGFGGASGISGVFREAWDRAGFRFGG